MADRTGQQFGNYRLLHLLGAGAFAEVYLGEHALLNTRAAIKILKKDKLTQEYLDGFLVEARRTARLEHLHIVRVLEFGIEKDQTPFLVMSYAPNGSLRQHHPRGTRLPLNIIVNYVNEAASALQHAHLEKLIHRDLKPENMLLGRNNEVLVSDFGVATVAHSSLSMPQNQNRAGTPLYMAPEQILGRPTPASDQYALGIIVYEWLSGECPFHSGNIEYQHVNVPAPSLRDKNPSIPHRVEQVIMKALAKDPHQRFPTVLGFAQALKQASQDQQQIPTFVRPLPTPKPSRPTPVQPTPAVIYTKPVYQQTPYPYSTFPSNAPPPSTPAAFSIAKLTTSGRHQVRRFGMMFGIILGIIHVVFSIIGTIINSGTDEVLGIGTSPSVNSYLYVVYALYFVFGLFAGLLAAKQTGKKKTGTLAGLLTGGFSTLVFAIANFIYTLVNFNAVRNAFMMTSTNSSSLVDPSNFMHPFNLMLVSLTVTASIGAVLTLIALTGGFIGGIGGKISVDKKA